MPKKPFVRLAVSTLAAGALLAAPLGGVAHAAYSRTLNFLTTGNGHGFQYFDTTKNRIVAFLERPYRYVAPPPGDPKSDGVGRRNLAYDLYFGLKGPGGAGWLADQPMGSAEYLDQSNIIHVTSGVAGVNADTYYFAPFGYEPPVGGNAMIALVHAPGATDAFMNFNFHMGGAPGQTEPGADGESIRASGADALVETGPGGGAMVYVALNGFDHAQCNAYATVKGGGDLGAFAPCSGTDQTAAFEKQLGGDGWYAVAMQYVPDPTQADNAAQALRDWNKGRTGDKILSDAQAEFESWRKPPPGDILCSDDEKKVWRQAEAVLRMGQVREAWGVDGRTNTGMVLASLPPGEWHTGWVRDAQYAIVALARMGHTDEAKMALDFFLGTAGPVSRFSSYVSNVPYRISVVRYYGTGEEEADYSGQTTPNVETDGWGMFMWTVRQYLEASGDTAWLTGPTKHGDKVYDALKTGVADALEANLEPNGIVKADSGIWEVHDANKKHFAYTSLAAARGFCDMAVIASKAGDTGNVGHYADLSKKVTSGIMGAFTDPQGAIGGSVEGLGANKYYDGSVAELFDWNVLQDWQGSTAKATLDMFNHLVVASGGFKRNDDGLSSYDNNEWILVDLRISNALRRGGRAKEADGYVANVVAQAAANFYLLPELYNAVPSDGPIGAYAGSIPMVGYGGGAYILTILDRSGKIEPNDCGDGKGMTLPAVTCSGVSTNPGSSSGGPGGSSGGPGGGPGGGGDNGAPTAAQVPYTSACLCNLHALPSRAPWALAFGLAPCAALVARRRTRRPRR